jgi:hypothetical protein
MSDLKLHRRLVLDAAAASAVGEASLVNRAGAGLQYGFVLTVSAASMVGSIAFAGACDTLDDGNEATWPLLATGAVEALTVLPTGLTVANATLSIAATLAIGTHRGVLYIAKPTNRVVPRYTYTSGGGTVSLKLLALEVQV